MQLFVFLIITQILPLGQPAGKAGAKGNLSLCPPCLCGDFILNTNARRIPKSWPFKESQYLKH